MKANRTEYPGMYTVNGRWIISVVNYGYGEEWMLLEGSLDDYFGNKAEWIETFKTKRDALNNIEKYSNGNPG